MSSETVFVKILDKDYQVACPPEEKHALLQAAANLDKRMREIRGSGNVIGLERIAVMAALNLSHELLVSEDQAKSAPSDQELAKLADKIDSVLAEL